MKAHERLICAIEHEEADRVPTFSQTIEPEFIKSYDEQIELKDDYGFQQIEFMVAKEIGLDSKWLHVDALQEPDAPHPEVPKELERHLKGRRLEKYGHLREKSWYVDGILKTPELLREWIDYVKLFEAKDYSHFEAFGKTWKHGCEVDCVPIPTAGGPFYISWASIGLDRLGYIMRKYPQDFMNLLNAWTDVTIEMHKCLFEQGADMVFICDDHAFKNSILISPKQFERFIEPIYRRMTNNAHKHGAKFIMHSDGDLWQEIPSLIRAGVDAIEPLEYESGMRLDTLKETYGDKITLIGNIPSSDVLTMGTVEDTIKATKKALYDAASGGGYILAPGSNIIGSAKPANVLAMIETNKKYGTYPINREKLLET